MRFEDLLQRFVPGRRAGNGAAGAVPCPDAAAAGPADAPPLAAGIAIATDTQEARQTAIFTAEGMRLARQEDWDRFETCFRALDRSRASTPGGTHLADLLARGARADVVGPIRQVLSDPGLLSAHAPRGGIAALESLLPAYPDHHGLALVVSHAHIDIAWAWRGCDLLAEVPARHWRAFHHHLDRASAILDPFDPFSLDSPALAAARCAHLPGDPAPGQRVCDDYEDLIDLDPANPRHLRALGVHLLPRWFGSYTRLHAEALRAMERSRDLWGRGGYALVLMDAACIDRAALSAADSALLVQALRDLVRHKPDADMLNRVAAFCAGQLQRAEPGPQGYRAGLTGTLRQVLAAPLTVLHPLIWAVPAAGAAHGALSDAERSRRGLDLARATLANLPGGRA